MTSEELQLVQSFLNYLSIVSWTDFSQSLLQNLTSSVLKKALVAPVQFILFDNILITMF